MTDVGVCMRVVDLPVPTDNAEVGVCRDCESDIWVGEALRAVKPVEYICARCAMAMAEDRFEELSLARAADPAYAPYLDAWRQAVQDKVQEAKDSLDG